MKKHKVKREALMLTVAGFLLLLGTSVGLLFVNEDNTWWYAYVESLAAILSLAMSAFSLFSLTKFRFQSQSSPPVIRAPGGALRRLAQLCFSKKVYDRVFEQVLCDLQLEYFEALANGDIGMARFALARGYVAFWLAFVAQLPVSLAKVVVELWLASK